MKMRHYLQGNALVYFRIFITAYIITINSVIGIANQIELTLTNTGRVKISMPLIISPLATDTTNAALGFIIA